MLECCKDDSLFSPLSMMQFKKFIRIVLMREGRTDGGIQVLDEWEKKCRGSVTCSVSTESPVEYFPEWGSLKRLDFTVGFAV